MAARDQGRQHWGVTAHGCRAPFGGDENVLKLDYGKACTMPRQYKKPLNCTF